MSQSSQTLIIFLNDKILLFRYLVFNPICDTGLLKSLSILNDKSTWSTFCSYEATSHCLLDGSWKVAGHQKNQATIRSLEFLAPPHPPEREQGLEMELTTDNEEASTNPQQYGVQGASRLANTSIRGRWPTPPPQGQKLRTLPDLALCISSSGDSPVSFSVSFNRGTRGAQSIEHPISAQVMNLWFMSLSPVSGSVLTAQSLKPPSDSASPSLSAPPLLTLCFSVSLSLKKTNKKKPPKKTKNQAFKKNAEYQLSMGSFRIVAQSTCQGLRQLVTAGDRPVIPS